MFGAGKEVVGLLLSVDCCDFKLQWIIPEIMLSVKFMSWGTGVRELTKGSATPKVTDSL